MHRIVSFIILFLLFPLSALPAETDFPEYDLSASFDIPASRVTGIASVKAEAEKVTFRVSNLVIKKVTVNGVEVKPDIKEGRLAVKNGARGLISIEYQAEFKRKSAVQAPDSDSAENVIDAEGISMTGDWYPRIEGLARYRLRANLPKGYEALSEADDIEKTGKLDGVEFLFRFGHPIPEISLVASKRYEIFTERVNDIGLYAYFFPEDRGLARTYLQQARKYLEMYEKLLSKYPYKRFSIVENFLPSGSSVPTFTLIGSEVVRLPFIPETSLGHEILHQWFGDSVYVATEKGNWAEGLTTYLSDHLYEEQAGRGSQYRKQLLLDYDAYVNSQNEISLREFKGGTDPASRAIGYGKAAMVFHMLRRSLGEDAFDQGLRLFIERMQFRTASWDDIRAALEKKSGRELTSFFKQWVDQKGLPVLKTGKGTVAQKGDLFALDFEVQQEGIAYALDLPAVIGLMQVGDKKETLDLDAAKKMFTVSADRDPHSLTIDGNYDIARKLTNRESPPVIAMLLGNQKPLIVPSLSNREAYAAVIDGLKRQGGEVKEADALKDVDIKASNVVALGPDNPVIGRLFGKVESPRAGFSLMVKKNPLNAGKVIVMINALNAREAEAAFPKIVHYGGFSSVAFDTGKNVSKKVDESGRGMEMELKEQAKAIDLSAVRTLNDAIEAASKKKIIYVGEFHDKYAHHLVELEIIRGLYEKDPKLAIGMEMFQRPFQKIVDDYIGGVIDEPAFLKGTEYFKRWGFDYNLYKPILDFARDRKIPVIALNQKKEITDKVAKDGLDSLTPEERKEIPQHMDFSDSEYRDRLKAVFEQHQGNRSFEFFYQAQILWDETMARSADEFMQKNGDYRVAVLAGSGHLAYGSGIPKRCYRRNSLPYFIILNDGDIHKAIADYLMFPQPLEGAAAPRLMAVLAVENGCVNVVALPEDSVSKKAGIRIGDAILAIGNEKVENVEDIKLVLFYKKQGETANVKVLRKGFFANKELEFNVKL